MIGNIISGIGAGIGSLISGVGTYAGYKQNADASIRNTNATNKINYDIAMKNLDFQREYNSQIFRREDTAVQRRAKDLENAGLSKTLAAGSAAGAGGSASTPQLNFDAQRPEYDISGAFSGAATNALNTFTGLMSMKQAVDLNNQQIASAKAQAEKTLADTETTKIENLTLAQRRQAELDNMLSNRNLTEEQRKNLIQQRAQISATIDQIRSGIEGTKLDTAIKSYDFDFAKKAGMPFNSSGSLYDMMKALLGMDEVNRRNMSNSLKELIGDTLPSLFFGGSSGLESLSSPKPWRSESKQKNEPWYIDRLRNRK